MKVLRSGYSVQRLAQVLEVGRSAFYRESGTGVRARSNTRLLPEIHRVFHEHKQRYGSPRICQQLRFEGFDCGENRVARLMKLDGLRGITPRKKAPRTTDSAHGGPIAPNVLKTTIIEGPNQVWAMDITYVKCGTGWVYLAAVLDLYLRKIVGWDLSETMPAGLVCSALRTAQERQGFPCGVILHSDRGRQYASKDFIDLSDGFSCTRSMSAKGNCYDNATMESFFGVIKREELDREEFPDINAVRQQVFEYIETYYNRKRIHSSLGMSPLAFEQTHVAETPAAEFSQACVAPQVGLKKAGKFRPRPRPSVATSSYPSARCSPAERASVSPDIESISLNPLANKHISEYQNGH